MKELKNATNDSFIQLPRFFNSSRQESYRKVAIMSGLRQLKRVLIFCRRERKGLTLLWEWRWKLSLKINLLCSVKLGFGKLRNRNVTPPVLHAIHLFSKDKYQFHFLSLISPLKRILSNKLTLPIKRKRFEFLRSKCNITQIEVRKRSNPVVGGCNSKIVTRRLFVFWMPDIFFSNL